MLNVKRSRVYFGVSSVAFIFVTIVAVLAGEPVNDKTKDREVPTDLGRPVIRQKANPCPTVQLEITSAPWCGPCQALKPIVKILQAEGYSIKIVSLDKPPRAVPELNYSQFDQHVKRVTGFQTKEEIVATFKEIEGLVF